MGLMDLFAGKPEDRFVRALQDEFRRALPQLPMRYEPEIFTLQLGDGRHPERVALAKPYEDWLAARGSARAQFAYDFVRGLLLKDDSQTPFAEAKARLIPVVRNRTFVIHQLGGKDAGEAVEWRPLPEPLCLLLAVDSALNLTYVTRRQLQNWGVDFDTALAAAMENLHSVSPPSFERQPGGFYVSSYGDYLDASRLLLPEIFAELDLAGDPVAIVANTTGLLVCGSNDDAALKAMAAFVAAGNTGEAAPISGAPLALQQGEWRTMPVDPARHPDLAALLVGEQVWLAELQEPFLAEELAAAGDDAAPSMLNARDLGGRPQTFTVLGADEALLPRADVVVLNGGEGAKVRRWHDVEAVLGPFAARPNTYPARYRAPAPTGEQLKRLTNAFTCPPGWEGFESDVGMVNISRTRGRR